MSNQLRSILDNMFPSTYLEQNHPIGSCTMLELKCHQEHQITTVSNQLSQSHRCKVSTEPGSRAIVRLLASKLDSSLKVHRARPSGLCPIRRAIFDQCFDELIRQTTINCLESGLLLFRVRNELRATQDCYKMAYESGVRFGVRKALDAELYLELNKKVIQELESEKNSLSDKLSNRLMSSELQSDNQLDLAKKMKKFYEKEMAKKDQIIEQQRAIIKALSQNIISEISLSQQK